MLYLMVASAHYFRADVAENAVALWVGVAIVAAIEANAIWGQDGADRHREGRDLV